MSETKHTPLPWDLWDEGISGPKTPSVLGPTCHEHIQLEKDPDFTWHTVVQRKGETIAIVPGDQQERDANAQLIVTSVNARPKVEELVEEIIRTHKGWGHLGWKAPPAMRKILAKAREVEAALGGKAE